MQTLRLKKGKEKSLERYHPWVFSGAFEQIPQQFENGSLAEIVNNDGEKLAVGHFHHGSIAVRVLAFGNTEIDQTFWNNKIKDTFLLRQKLGLLTKSNNVFRLIHGEGDGLPGLIIDFYNGTAVIQCHTLAMLKSLNQITEALTSQLKNHLTAIYNKSEATVPNWNNNLAQDGFILGNDTSNTVLENNNRFEIDFANGQKTGFFVDQRENRNLVASIVSGKTLLNTFCYSGGFSIYALNAGAELVHSVDSSSKAIELLEKNLILNPKNKDKHQSFVADTYRFLSDNTLDYDVVILDPPAYAKHQKALNNALKGYRKINQKAIEKMKSGSLLLTFSCSQAVDLQHFKTAVFSAAALAKREVKILQTLHQPADHPVSLYHPEGEYLKGFLLLIGNRF